MLTLNQIAKHIGGVPHGNGEHAVFAISSLSRATSGNLAYFDNPRLKTSLEQTQAGIVFIREEHLHWCKTNALVVSAPLSAMQQVSKLFIQSSSDLTTIDTTAKIHPLASIGKDVHIGAYCVIGEGVVIHDNVRIGENCRIEPFVTIGAHSVLSHHVVVHTSVLLGEHVMVQAGVVIGALPFSFQKEKGVWQAQAALGGVTIADKVHLGANMVIDRGTMGDTFIAKGVCIDNLVQVAHDAYIGDNTLIAGCAAIGAHAWIGADCIVGGGCGIASFVRLADDVVITGMSTVAKSIPKPGVYSSGTMVHEHNRWRRNVARFKRLDDYMIKLTALARQQQVEDK